MQIEVTRRRDAVLVETITVSFPVDVNPDDFDDDDLAEMFLDQDPHEEFIVIDSVEEGVYQVAEL